ncbi:phage baseplate assembly protein [Bosea sp. BK604]|uniref:phage baseplate assembly protein domain-containing protein n=1 Tax=Bosea sp. BK604 TaxID=2512180 RepID=UPI001051389A|nr:phage baseplate assembly protein [Bosea sp. BK604]TCR60939.1 bacteriophage Mu Gp45 protein [Bosea sp. BK604]
MVSRATLEASNDDPKLQEVDLNLSHDEKARGVEHVQPYGFSSRPVAPSKESDGSTKRAEAFVVHPDGSRSHPVALVIADRRFRPKGMKAGEVQVHDNQGQSVHLAEDGIVVNSPKKLTFKVGDNASITMNADGTVTIRGSAIKFEQG